LRSTNAITLHSSTRSTHYSAPEQNAFDSHADLCRRILAYLIPLRILKGHLPSTELLQRFPNLDAIFTPFIRAIRAGDLQSYDRALETGEQRLLELNLWLTLEKARELCLRSLFRKV
jgi:hypothetical protein